MATTPFTIVPPFAGKGVWIWYLNGAEGGNLDAIAEKALAHGVSWVAVKAGDGPLYWGQFQETLGLKERGLKVYSWSYHYGGDGEEYPVIAALNLGSDGHIFDIEAEFAHLPDAVLRATNLLTKVLGTCPEATLAYAPLPVIDNFPGLPYEIFNGKGILALPQFYTKVLGTGSDYTLERLMAIWEQWQATWAMRAPAIYPILQGYGAQTPANLGAEMRRCLQRYGGASVWAWHTLTPEMWEAIRDA